MTEQHDTVLNVWRFGGKTVSITEKISGGFMMSVSYQTWNIEFSITFLGVCGEWEQNWCNEDYLCQGLKQRKIYLNSCFLRLVAPNKRGIYQTISTISTISTI